MKADYQFEGLQWHLDPSEDCIQEALSRIHVWEPSSTPHVVDLVLPGWSCLDIGAHIGYYTMMLSSLVGRRGRVVALEANDERFARLVRHCGINELHWAQPVKWCAGMSPEVDRQLINLLCGPRINFIKVDVDGPDLAVWRMLAPFLKGPNRPEVLLAEVCGYCLDQHEGKMPYAHWPRVLIDELQAHGYEIRLEHDWSVITKDTPIGELADFNTSGFNIFALRNDLQI